MAEKEIIWKLTEQKAAVVLQLFSIATKAAGLEGDVAEAAIVFKKELQAAAQEAGGAEIDAKLDEPPAIPSEKPRKRRGRPPKNPKA